MAKSFEQLVKRTANRKTQRRAALRTRELLMELLLSEIRKLSGKSQREIAAKLGIKQPSLSKLEKQSDMQIVTYYAESLQAFGRELDIIAARLPDADILD